MSRLKRVAIGAGIVLVGLGVVTPVWYRNHYIVPPLPELKVTLPSPNGFDTLQTAVKLEVKEKDGIFVSPRPLNLNNEAPYRYPEQPLAGRLKLLAANQASIAKTREALRQQYQVPIPKGMDMDYPRYAQLREQARMLSFAAKTYADSGNLEESIHCSLDGIEMGVKMPRGGAIVPTLVGVACEAIAHKPAWQVADKLDAKTAREAALRLAKMDEQRWPGIESLDLDRQITLRTYVLPIFKEGPRRTWDISSVSFNSPDDLPQADIDIISSDEEERKATLPEQAQLLWMRSQVVYYGPKTVIENSDKWMKAVREHARHPWGSNRPPIIEPGDPLNKSMLLPYFPQVEFKIALIQVQSRLLQTYLALRAYKLEHSSYPESLETLVKAGYLKAVPVDPFSPTRAPLNYKPDGTLWSVGPDAKNDNGKPIDMEGKRGYVTITKTGDYVARVNTW